MAKINLVVAQTMLDVEDDINRQLAMEDDWYDDEVCSQAWLDAVEDARREAEYDREMEQYDPYYYDPHPFVLEYNYDEYHYNPDQGPE